MKKKKKNNEKKKKIDGIFFIFKKEIFILFGR